MNDDEVMCPECDAIFTLIWRNSIDTEQGPVFCPFCGSEDIDYMRKCGE